VVTPPLRARAVPARRPVTASAAAAAIATDPLQLLVGDFQRAAVERRELVGDVATGSVMHEVVEPQPEYAVLDIGLGQVRRLATLARPSQQKVPFGRPLVPVFDLDLCLVSPRFGGLHFQDVAGKRESGDQSVATTPELDTSYSVKHATGPPKVSCRAVE
jgi:hypothetical protein